MFHIIPFSAKQFSRNSTYKYKKCPYLHNKKTMLNREKEK